MQGRWQCCLLKLAMDQQNLFFSFLPPLSSWFLHWKRKNHLTPDMMGTFNSGGACVSQDCFFHFISLTYLSSCSATLLRVPSTGIFSFRHCFLFYILLLIDWLTCRMQDAAHVLPIEPSFVSPHDTVFCVRFLTDLHVFIDSQACSHTHKRAESCLFLPSNAFELVSNGKGNRICSGYFLQMLSTFLALVSVQRTLYQYFLQWYWSGVSVTPNILFVRL